jgi:hypothetical protein
MSMPMFLCDSILGILCPLWYEIAMGVPPWPFRRLSLPFEVRLVTMPIENPAKLSLLQFIPPAKTGVLP